MDYFKHFNIYLYMYRFKIHYIYNNKELNVLDDQGNLLHHGQFA